MRNCMCMPCPFSPQLGLQALHLPEHILYLLSLNIQIVLHHRRLSMSAPNLPFCVLAQSIISLWPCIDPFFPPLPWLCCPTPCSVLLPFSLPLKCSWHGHAMPCHGHRLHRVHFPQLMEPLGRILHQLLNLPSSGCLGCGSQPNPNPNSLGCLCHGGPARPQLRAQLPVMWPSLYNLGTF